MTELPIQDELETSVLRLEDFTSFVATAFLLSNQTGAEFFIEDVIAVTEIIHREAAGIHELVNKFLEVDHEK